MWAERFRSSKKWRWVPEQSSGICGWNLLSHFRWTMRTESEKNAHILLIKTAQVGLSLLLV